MLTSSHSSELILLHFLGVISSSPWSFFFGVFFFMFMDYLWERSEFQVSSQVLFFGFIYDRIYFAEFFIGPCVMISSFHLFVSCYP